MPEWSILKIIPGLCVAALITLAAQALVLAETFLLGYELMDGLVFAIVLGTLFHTVAGLAPSLKAGVDFSATVVLEIAIVLLGASVSIATIADAGGLMIGIVAGTVILSLMASYGLCRMLGLPDQLATLVACGNSICGNSAIVAAAPVIGARSDDVAASVAFTAALGIVVVILLPPLFPLFRFSEWQYGVFAGMTVYAVPQVLAATAPVGVASVQMGTLVKLLRVLMLGPVILLLRLKTGSSSRQGGRLPFGRLVPWFIVGFFLMMCLRSLAVITGDVLDVAKSGSAVLTTVSMAALGLSVDMRTVFASGGRVLLAGILSLATLGMLSVLGLAILHSP